MSQILVTGEAKIRDIQGPVVSNSGVITALDGDASQYVRGDGTLADFPTSTGGGSSVSYYLNSSVSQGTIGGVAYRQLSKTPISGAGTDIAISTTGYVASYITDANDPALLEVPAGNFNCEFYFSVNNNTGNPFVYAEVYKYDGSAFTLLGTSVGVPEYITEGTVINPYYFAVPVAVAALTVTDRIAIRIYVNVDGRTVTLHTENNHLCQVVTTFSKGLISLNNLTRQNQFFATGTSGTDFAISSSVATHTFNLPVASAANTGKLSSTDWSTFNGKVPYTGATAPVDLGGNSLYFNNSQAIFGRNFTGTTAYALIGVNPSNKVSIDTSALGTVFGGDLTGTSYIANGIGIQGGTIALKQNGSMSAGTGYTTLGGLSAGQLVIYFGDANLYAATFLNTSLTDSRSYTLPNLSGTLALLEGTQIFTGAKTFANNIKIDNGVDGNYIGFKQYGTGSAGTGGFTSLYAISTNVFGIRFGITGAIQFDSASITTIRTYLFPNADGTIALTSDLSSYVPYTGATGAVNLGFNLLTTNSINLDGNSVSGVLNIKSNSSITTSGAGYVSLVSGNVNQLSFVFNGGNSATFTSVSLSASRTYSLPDAGGTIALTSGTQTFTGATTFSSDITVNGVTVGKGGSSVAFNTAIGISALAANTTGTYNTAIGESTLSTQTTANNNTAIGSAALAANTSGTPNTAIGRLSLATNTTGGSNTAIGYQSLYLNTTGGGNTAIGVSALTTNTIGSNNVAIGNSALFSSTTSDNNTAIGVSSLTANTTGTQNTAIGINSGVNNTTGSGNSFIGYNAGAGITTGGGNTILGNAGTLTSSLTNNIIIADGNGNIRYQWNGTNNVFGNPLSGTSATFSGNLEVNGQSVVTNAGTLTFMQLNNTSVGGQAYTLVSAGVSNPHSEAVGTFYIRNSSTSTTPFKIASTGAATFSSSVTAGVLSRIGDVFIGGRSGTYAAYTDGVFGDNLHLGATSVGGAVYINTALSRNLIINPVGGNVGIGTSSPSYQLQLSTDSAAKPTSALWTIASDERIKENINPYKKGLQELLNINPVTYDYNGLGGFVKGKGGVGIIAQEIIDILPDSVSSIKAKLNETDEEETDILNFNGHELIYVLINSIKEQQAQIEELKSLIAAK